MTINTNALLASYATFKELYDSRKYASPYQILKEFIQFIILDKSLFSFTIIEIQDNLRKEFGFNPPVAVINTAIKKVPNVTRNNQLYRVDFSKLKSNSSFQSYRKNAECNSKYLLDSLERFISQKQVNITIDINNLKQEFIAFLLDDNVNPSYYSLISEYILLNENNEGIKNVLSEIREGIILYSGLNYNVSEYGSLHSKLTLYIDTEIVFDIAGLNGELYKVLCEDFLDLVNTANKKEKLISLKLFPEVKDEIDDYYKCAERIVDGKGGNSFQPAMKSIISGCKSVSDIQDKLTDLYRMLQLQYGITIENKTNYLNGEDLQYNLEGAVLSDYPSADPNNFEGYQYCSHINVIRKGDKTQDFFESKCMFVTNTKRVLDISAGLRDLQKKENNEPWFCDYAVSLSKITNLLWYKLNRGFGSHEFPKNLDTVIKARLILAGYISQEISSTYLNIQKKYKNGELSEAQAANRIIALRQKPILPEDINEDNIDEGLAFSEEYFEHYAEEIEANRKLLSERNQTIGQLNNSVDNLEEKLKQEQENNANKQRIIDEQEKQLSIFKQNEKDRKRRIQRRISIAKFILIIIRRILFVIVFIVLVFYICRKLNYDFGTWLSVVIGAVTLIPSIILILKSDYKKYLKSNQNSD